MQRKAINFIPALHKVESRLNIQIFDEIIVNSADNALRSNSMTYINVFYFLSTRLKWIN